MSNNGDVFVADGYCNSRVMHFSPTGSFIQQITLPKVRRCKRENLRRATWYPYPRFKTPRPCSTVVQRPLRGSSFVPQQSCPLLLVLSPTHMFHFTPGEAAGAALHRGGPVRECAVRRGP